MYNKFSPKIVPFMR